MQIETLVDYVLYLKALPDSLDRNEKAQRKLMGAYFESLIDAIVYGMYFPEEFSGSENQISMHLENLPEIELTKNLLSQELVDVFQALYNPDNPVRKHIHFMDSISAIRVIEERAKSWSQK